MWTRCLRVAPVVLSLSLAPGLAFAKCQMFEVATLPVTMAGLRPLVPAKINGVDAFFVADSGASYSIITPGAAAQNGLKVRPIAGELKLGGVGRDFEASVTTVEHLRLANQTISHIEFIVGGSDIEGGAAGLLGQNVLGMADAEYDLAKGVIRLMRPGDGCTSALLAYWVTSQPYSEMDIDRATGLTMHTSGIAYVNGNKIHVVFDTGAGTSFLRRSTAQRAGFRPDGPGVVSAGFNHGIGAQNFQTWIATFASFKIGDEEVHNARLRVGDANLPAGDMLLGADFFLSHRVYVANSRDKLYFTYNGGPVFNLHRLASRPAGTEPSASASSQGEVDGEEPMDAAGFARRGAAYAARNDFEHAIEDLTRACELNPKEASYFRQRGLAYLDNGELPLAIADLDEAVRLKPDDIEALVSRAGLRLASHDVRAASADLQAADRLAPRQANVRLQIAADYTAADMLEAALTQYDLWIDAHPDDGALAVAKDGRCRVRALLGSDLDKALKDCNDAVRMIAKSSEFLDSRGLVLLRLGQYDNSIADYDASLDMNPDDAWSLYGRGVDRLRKGMANEGQSDIAAAAAISPLVEAQAKKHGIVP